MISGVEQGGGVRGAGTPLKFLAPICDWRHRATGGAGGGGGGGGVGGGGIVRGAGTPLKFLAPITMQIKKYMEIHVHSTLA